MPALMSAGVHDQTTCMPMCTGSGQWQSRHRLSYDSYCYVSSTGACRFPCSSEPERDAGVHGRVPDLARVIQRRHNLALAVVMGTHMESIIVDTEVRLRRRAQPSGLRHLIVKTGLRMKTFEMQA